MHIRQSRRPALLRHLPMQPNRCPGAPRDGAIAHQIAVVDLNCIPNLDVPRTESAAWSWVVSPTSGNEVFARTWRIRTKSRVGIIVLSLGDAVSLSPLLRCADRVPEPLSPSLSTRLPRIRTRCDAGNIYINRECERMPLVNVNALSIAAAQDCRVIVPAASMANTPARQKPLLVSAPLMSIWTL